MTRIAFALIALFVVGVACQAGPTPAAPSTDPKARCLIYFDDDITVQDNSTKTCLDCQIQCVGLNDGQCGSFSWNGTVLQNPEAAPIFQCATLPVADDPAIGTCAFFAIGELYPTTFSLKYCDDCRALCVGDSSCEKIAWGGNVLTKGAQLLSFACPPKPSPRPSSPAIVVPPSPYVDVFPSPAVTVVPPSPAVTVVPPSPAKLVPSPAVVVTPPSPAVAIPSPAVPLAKSPSPASCVTPYAYVAGNPQLSTLKAAIDAAGLASFLQNSSLVATLFAPTNAAFDAAFAALGITAEQALADTTALTAILQFHLVPGVAVSATQLTNAQQLTTALGAEKITVSIVPPAAPTFTPTVTGTPAEVVTEDVRACAAVIHVIDQVLLAPSQS